VNGGVRGGGGGFGNDHFQTLAPFQHANPNPSQLNYSTYTPNSAPPTQTNFPPLYNASHAPQPTYLPYGNPSNPQDAYQHQSNGPFDGASQADFMGGAIFGERTDSSGVRLLTVGQLVPREAQQHVEQSADQHSLTYSFDNNRYGDSSWANPLPNSHPRPHDYVSPKESDTPGGDSPHSSRTKPIGSADTTTVASGPSSDSPFGTLELPSASSRPPNTVRVRRSTYVPGWSAPPRVLVVDDDSVNAKLSSKFLEVFGCTTDVAVDGIGAVNKMNLEKYDRTSRCPTFRFELKRTRSHVIVPF
jgi:osomolarity two-component system response regulator SKN7